MSLFTQLVEGCCETSRENGMVELNLFCRLWLEQERKLQISHEELPDCTSLPGEVQTYTMFEELFLVAKKHYGKYT